VKNLFDVREQKLGLKMVYEPRYLRFFQARFERLKASPQSLPQTSKSAQHL